MGARRVQIISPKARSQERANLGACISLVSDVADRRRCLPVVVIPAKAGTHRNGSPLGNPQGGRGHCTDSVARPTKLIHARNGSNSSDSMPNSVWTGSLWLPRSKALLIPCDLLTYTNTRAILVLLSPAAIRRDAMPPSHESGLHLLPTATIQKQPLAQGILKVTQRDKSSEATATKCHEMSQFEITLPGSQPTRHEL